MNFTRTARALVAISATISLSAVAAACGDDGPDDEPVTTVAPVDTTAETAPETTPETAPETTPEVTEPVATEPAVTEPAVTEPVATEPTGSEPGSSSVPADEPTIEDAEAVLIGLTEDEATEAAEAEGWILRPTVIDGEDQAVTMDLRPNRVNVELTDGEVTAVLQIG